MAEPVMLYPSDGGEPLVCAAPAEVMRLLATGEWALVEAKPAPKPPAKPASKAGAK